MRQVFIGVALVVGIAAFDILRTDAWALVIFGGLPVIVGLIRVFGRSAQASLSRSA